MRRILASAILCALTASCGGSEGGGGGGAAEYADSVADAFQSKVLASNGGVTGTLALQDILNGAIRSRSLHVEVSADYQTAFVTIGGSRYTLNTTGGGFGTEDGGFYLRDGGAITAIFGTPITDSYLSVFQWTDANGLDVGFGIIGAETRPEAIEALSAVATYIGLWTFQDWETPGTGNQNGGFLDMEVDFGAASNQVDAIFEDASPGATFGTMTASISGNGFSGVLVVDGSHPTFAGSLNVDGTFFGPSAEQVGGIISGQIDGPGGRGNVIGHFQADDIPLP